MSLRIRLVASTLAAAALTGCGGNYAVYGASAGATVPAGASVVVDGGVSASISLGSTASSVIAAGAIVAILAAGNGLSPLSPPRMREDRTVNEQDCTKPIANPAANLKCR